MKNDFETKFTGWSLIISALMLLFGWVLLPHHIGEYIEVADFAAVQENFWPWVWIYRIHIFGWVIMGAGIMGLASLTFKRPYRILLMPGAGVTIVGTFVLALATAYYYSYGAWGIGQTMDKSAAEIDKFMEGIKYTNHYVTCMTRFGRVFSGVGFVLLGAGFLKWNITAKWMSIFTILLGLTAMGIVMLIPENYGPYKPVFYIKTLWLLAMGATVLRQGLNLPEEV